jgi:hypothetical protein
VGRFELVRAIRTARGTTFDAAQALESEPDFGSTAAVIAHVNLLWFTDGLLQEAFCLGNYPI